MQKVIQRFYILLIFIFFMLYNILINMDASSNYKIYCIGLIIGAIVLAIIPFFTNKCKKIYVRKFYLSSFITNGAFVCLYSIYLLLAKHIEQNDILKKISMWVLLILQAVFITNAFFLAIFTVKDWFKKDYSFQKFDLDAIMMVTNVFAYIATIYASTNSYGLPEVSLYINPIDLHTIEKVTIEFKNFDILLNASLYISIGYVVCFSIIQIIQYFRFDKTNNNQ